MQKAFRFYEFVLSRARKVLSDPVYRNNEFKKELLDEYLRIKDDPYEQRLFVYFNFEKWI